MIFLSFKRVQLCSGSVNYPTYELSMLLIVIFNIFFRRNICQAHGVPMAGAWVTSIGSVKATKRAGWETVYEITREDLEKVLNLKLENVPATYKYRVLRA